MRMKDSNKRQIPVPLGEIQSVPNHENIWNLKPDVIRLNVNYSTRRFIEQHANPDPAGFEPPQFFQHPRHGMAGIQYIIDQQHVAAMNVKPQLLGKYQLPGSRVVAVA